MRAEPADTVKVLVIEDSERLRRALGEGLRRSGFIVDLARDGEQGLGFTETVDYDVIVLDLVLPKLDGLSVLKRIRLTDNPASVLILSAKDLPRDRVTGLESGADDYLVKPFSFDELVARVRALGRRRNHHKSPTVVVGPLVLDTARRQVYAHGLALQLTPAEHNMLEQLILKRGRVLSKPQLFDCVHDSSSHAISNVVEVSISTLRKKLGSSGVKNFVKTKRGFGYYIE